MLSLVAGLPPPIAISQTGSLYDIATSTSKTTTAAMDVAMPPAHAKLPLPPLFVELPASLGAAAVALLPPAPPAGEVEVALGGDAAVELQGTLALAWPRRDQFDLQHL
jgi:hypothetical protein